MAAQDDAVTNPPLIGLSAFWRGQPADDFTFARFYWADGEGVRQGVSEKLLAKRQPVGKGQGIDTAARVEVLLPPEAPEEYLDPDFLARNFDAGIEDLGPTAYVQVTMRFPNAVNLHGPYERCREWFRDTFVLPRKVPVLLVLHAPHQAGSDNPPHVHGLVLPRSLFRFGWNGPDLTLGNDKDYNKILKSWRSQIK